MDFPSHPVLEQCTGFLLRRVAASSFARFSEIAARHGLHPMHYGLLEILDAEGPISQQALGRKMGIDPSTMVARMDALERLSLAERQRASGDRRAYEISLTDTGRSTLAALREEAREHGRQFFAALTPSEREQFHVLLAKLAAALDEHT